MPGHVENDYQMYPKNNMETKTRINILNNKLSVIIKIRNRFNQNLKKKNTYLKRNRKI